MTISYPKLIVIYKFWIRNIKIFVEDSTQSDSYTFWALRIDIFIVQEAYLSSSDVPTFRQGPRRPWTRAAELYVQWRPPLHVR